MPPVTRFRASEGHLLIYGDDKLAHRVARELTTRYRERVTVILPSKRHGHGPQIDRLPGVRVLERDELTSQAFTDAQITSARALALLRQDDVGNFHAALRARELNPGHQPALGGPEKVAQFILTALNRDYLLAPQDQLLVLATQAGIGQTLVRNRKPTRLT